MPATTQLRIIAPTRQRHLHAVSKLLTATFHRPEDSFTEEHIRQRYLTHSHYCWKASRIGLYGADIVTHFGVWDYQMAIGSARVRVGGIGAVATAADYRKRGFMALTAPASIAAMRAQGFHLSLLFGIDDFYHRFRYVPAWAEHVYIVETSELPGEPPRGRCRPFRLGNQPEFAELHNREYSCVTGMAIRPTYRYRPTESSLAGLCWRDSAGNMAGYIAYDHNAQADPATLHYSSSAGDADEQLRAFARVARKLACTTVRFVGIPEQGELAQRLRGMQCRRETSFRRTGGPMVRLLNLPATCAQLCGELTRRLAGSGCAGWQGVLRILNGEDDVYLALADGQVTITSPTPTPHRVEGGDAIAQLLIGSAPQHEICRVAGMKLYGDAPQLLEALFPAQHPSLLPWDRF